MTKTFRTLDDVDVKGKRVLLRVDLNVPMDAGKVTDTTRLERVMPTITELSGKGAKVILLAHFGRPKGRDDKNSLKPVAAALADVIKKPVGFADDCIGEPAAKAIAAMADGDILCLENTRFHPEEEKNDPAFVAKLAELGDIWVNDAHVHLLERMLVEQQVDPFACGEPAAGVLRIDALFAAAELGCRPPFVQCFQDVLHDE